MRRILRFGPKMNKRDVFEGQETVKVPKEFFPIKELRQKPKKS